MIKIKTTRKIKFNDAQDRPNQKKNIAICSPIEAKHNVDLFSPSIGEVFIGAGWVYEFKQMVDVSAEFNVASGRLACKLIKSGAWSPQATLVIDELGTKHGDLLISQGCLPFLQTAFESPLYAPRFFDQYLNGHKFRFMMGPHARAGLGAGHFQMRFPCDGGGFRPIGSGSRSPHVVCVAANKYRNIDYDISMVNSVKTGAKFLRHKFLEALSPSYAQALRDSLHLIRLRVMESLSRSSALAVYGRGWENDCEVPARHRETLEAIRRCSWMGVATNKRSVLEKYEFALCIENVSMPGYVTEKVVDAIAAGTVPIYLGAPDIEDFLPREAFIDLREGLSDCDNFLKKILSLSSDAKQTLRAAGRDFLASKHGVLHTPKGYAGWLFDLIRCADLDEMVAHQSNVVDSINNAKLDPAKL